MSLTVHKIEVRDFRNYKDFDLSLAPGLTIIVGPNAVGKTNLVETLQLLTETVSFRNPGWAELIRWGADESRLCLHAEDGERRHDVEMKISSAGRRSYSLNGKPRKSPSAIAGLIPCVLFTPEDLRLVKDSAERRRAALDSIGSQLSESYGRLKSEYDRVVRQRNALLKQDELEEDVLAPWDERLVTLGAKLTQHRRGLFSKVQKEASDIYGELASERLTCDYESSWERDGIGEKGEDPTAALEEHLARKRGEERSRGVTLTGPHRDEIKFAVEGRDARSYASQGQQRTIALAWKLAEVAVVRQVKGSRPILLLDDVMSELDENRRHALAGLVREQAQTVITTTNLGYFEQEWLSAAQVVELK